MTNEDFTISFDGPERTPTVVEWNGADCLVTVRGPLWPRQLYLAAKLVQEVMASKRQSAKVNLEDQHDEVE